MVLTEAPEKEGDKARSCQDTDTPILVPVPLAGLVDVEASLPWVAKSKGL